MDRESDKKLEAKFFGAELRTDLPSLDLHPPFYPEGIEIEVDKFLYDKSNLGEDVIAIIYGVGKGVMKKTVLEFLKKHPLVEGVKEKSGHCLVALEKSGN